MSIANKGRDRYLILIRHSAVRIDPNIASPEWQLSEIGRDRCLSFAERLKSFDLSLLVTSHEPKAMETGSLIASTLDKTYKSVDGLQEHDRTDVPFFANEKTFRKAVEDFYLQPDTLIFGHETAEQSLTRFSQAVYREIELNPSKKLAVVTHGTVMTLFVCQHNPQFSHIDFWSSLKMPCAVVLNLPELSFHTLLELGSN